MFKQALKQFLLIIFFLELYIKENIFPLLYIFRFKAFQLIQDSAQPL